MGRPKGMRKINGVWVRPENMTSASKHTMITVNSITIREAIEQYIPIDTLRDAVISNSISDMVNKKDFPDDLKTLIMALAQVLKPELAYQIRSPSDIAAYCMADMSILDKEELRVIVLDVKNRIMLYDTVYIGTLNSCPVRVGEILRKAISVNGSSMIIVHNHPSGDPTPSPEDVSLTRALRDAGSLISVELLDHLVIGRGKYVSMRGHGLGF